MEYTATSKFIRSGTRRVRLVADAIRKMSPVVALNYLDVTTKIAADPLSKVIRSALANAKMQNAQVEKLRFKRVEVMGGPFMKRMRPVSRGQGHGYKKRMTHITIVLTDGDMSPVSGKTTPKVDEPLIQEAVIEKPAKKVSKVPARVQTKKVTKKE